MNNPIVTAYTGKNRVLFSNIAPLYIPEGSIVADVTYGNGNFWRDIDVSKYQFYPTDLVTGTDFRKLPYPDHMFDVVVIDPPYMHGTKNVKASIDRADGGGAYYHKKYGAFPNLCYVHPSMLPEFDRSQKHFTDAGIEIRVSRSILPNHFWIGVE